MNSDMRFRYAERKDVPLILQFIRDLAEYEKMPEEVVTDEATLEKWIFDKQKAEVIFALEDGKEVGSRCFSITFPLSSDEPGYTLRICSSKPNTAARDTAKAC